jgi:SAM-dependent methyltransferase
VAVVAEVRSRIAGAVVSFRRWRLIRAVVRGSGLEIGALHAPIRAPAGARVTYVDRLPTGELRHHYPELDGQSLVDVAVVDDAETLSSIPSASQDFVVASHVLEHCEDPLGAVGNWLRVLKPGKPALLAVPDRRFTFDSARPATTLDHVLRDHAEGPAVSRESHYREWVALVERAPREAVETRARELGASGYRIHFHAWDRDGLSELLRCAVSRAPVAARVVELKRNRWENLAHLARAPGEPS